MSNVFCAVKMTLLNMHSLIVNLSWNYVTSLFNGSLHQINVSLTPLQCFLNLPTPNTNLSDNQTKDLRLLLLYAKQYHYACKTMQKKQDTSEFISKFINQLEIDKWLDVTMLPFPLATCICTKLERNIACNFYYSIHYRLFFIRILSVVTTLFFCTTFVICCLF